MTIGERIKAKRKEKNISVEYVAKALGVSVSTVYRYEDSTIEKIPIKVFDKLCQIFETSASELMGNDSTVQKTADSELPREFENAGKLRKPTGSDGIYLEITDPRSLWRL
mgnify:CR=1 FL=1